MQESCDIRAKFTFLHYLWGLKPIAMTKHLDELLDLNSKANQKTKVSKKAFLSRNFEKIDKALKLGHDYKVIIETLEKDGFVFTYNYFSQVLIEEYEARGLSRKKQKRVNSGNQSGNFVESKPASKGAQPTPQPKKTNSDLSPEEQGIKDELERIRNDTTLTFEQKREAAAKATAPLKNQNPLTNRRK